MDNLDRSPDYMDFLGAQQRQDQVFDEQRLIMDHHCVQHPGFHGKLFLDSAEFPHIPGAYSDQQFQWNSE